MAVVLLPGARLAAGFWFDRRYIVSGPTATPTATRTLTPTPTRTLTPTATPTATPIPGGCTNLLVNGDFEGGSGWTFGATARPAGYVSTPVYSGARRVAVQIQGCRH